MFNDVSKENLLQELQDLKGKSFIRDELVTLLCEAIRESSLR
jgi:hypothetical protein